jgi:hypothetical protein
MQPSSTSAGPERGSPLRRWGPLVGIVVVIAVVIAVVAINAGGNDKSSTGAGDTTTTSAGQTAPPEGAVSFSQAKKDHLDVAFPDTCDQTTGRVAIPNYFAPECYANVADNGGATAPGVTGDTITVVAYIAPDTDPILDFITGPINADDTGAQAKETYQGYTDLYNQYFQLYGRHVDLKFLDGSGTSDDPVQARADAVKAVEEMHAFAVWGGPVLSPAWTEEIKARNVVCLGCPAVIDNAPSSFPVVASGAQTRLQLAEYIEKKLAGKPAEFAGDDAFKTKDRVFGQIYLQTAGGNQDKDAANFKAALAEANVALAEQIQYQLDPGTLAQQAATVIAKLKSSGVTTVLFNGDPIAPATFTREATAQGYFPEWIYGGSALVDTTAFGRTFDQQQWAHAFGISSLPARTAPNVGAATYLYNWFKGTDPPANDTAGVLWPQPALFFAALQAAGPHLTLDTFRDGLFSATPAARAVTQPYVSYGDKGIWPGTDYNGIDDFTEIWWDPNATGVDELNKQGTGMVRYVDGGKRYLPGEWTSDLKVFDPANSVTMYTELPPGETPKGYPSPAGGG